MIRRLVFALGLLGAVAGTSFGVDGDLPPFEVPDAASSENFRNIYYSASQADASITTLATKTVLISTATDRTCIDSPTFCVDTLNNGVGVRTANPQFPLDVNGNTNITGAITQTGGTVSIASVTVAGSVTANTLSVSTISPSVGTAIYFDTNGTRRCQLDGNAFANYDNVFRVVGQNLTAFADYSRIDDVNTGLRLLGNDAATLDAGGVDVVTISSFSVRLTGVTNGGEATAGDVGEFQQTRQATFINTTGTTGQWANIAALSLTAGDWDVMGTMEGRLNGAVVTATALAVSTSSGNVTTDHVGVYNVIDMQIPTAAVDSAGSVPVFRVLTNVSTTVYLKGQFAFTGGPPKYAGTITARRRR